MFTIFKIISGKSGQFVGYRLKNPFGVILDIDEKIARHIFPLTFKNISPYKKTSAIEVQEVFKGEEINNILPTLFTKYSRMLLGVQKDYIPEVILLDNPDPCVNLKNTGEGDFVIHFPLNSDKLLPKAVKTLKIAEDFIHSRIESAFFLEKVFVNHIYKDGTVEYHLIPMDTKEFDSIINSCRQICNKYSIIVSPRKVNLYKDLSYDAIALQFNDVINFRECSFPVYYYDNGLGYREDITSGYLYELGYLKNIIRTEWENNISSQFLNDYMPINKLITLNNKVFHIINGYRTVFNLAKEANYAYTMVEEGFENQGLLKFISTASPHITCQKSYKNTITSFRVPVNYSEIDVSRAELCEGISKEFFDTEWILDYIYEVVDTKIEFLESEIWLYIILEERG